MTRLTGSHHTLEPNEVLDHDIVALAKLGEVLVQDLGIGQLDSRDLAGLALGLGGSDLLARKLGQKLDVVAVQGAGVTDELLAHDEDFVAEEQVAGREEGDGSVFANVGEREEGGEAGDWLEVVWERLLGDDVGKGLDGGLDEVSADVVPDGRADEVN